MIMVQTAVRSLLQTDEMNPQVFLDQVNHTIYDNVQRMGSDKNLTLALLDYRDGCLSLSGQHEEMIVVRSGVVERIETIDLGFPLGWNQRLLSLSTRFKFISTQEMLSFSIQMASLKQRTTYENSMVWSSFVRWSVKTGSDRRMRFGRR